ncbi:hypothetical protein ACT3TB_16360 [Micrococcaceae sp. AOP34-BR2-30]
MVRYINRLPADHGREPTSYREAIVAAYAATMHLWPEDISEAEAQKILRALIAHASNDEEAARQAEIDLEQVHRDRTTVDAIDHLPLMITGTAPGIPGRFYFTRPPGGWPRPGYRHPH